MQHATGALLTKFIINIVTFGINMYSMRNIYCVICGHIFNDIHRIVLKIIVNFSDGSNFEMMLTQYNSNLNL